MAQRLVAIKTLYNEGLHKPPTSVKGVMYDVWVTPDGYGKWKFRFGLVGQPTGCEECNREAAETIFGYEVIEKHFALAYGNDHIFFARSIKKDEEDIL